MEYKTNRFLLAPKLSNFYFVVLGKPPFFFYRNAKTEQSNSALGRSSFAIKLIFRGT